MNEKSLEVVKRVEFLCGLCGYRPSLNDKKHISRERLAFSCLRCGTRLTTDSTPPQNGKGDPNLTTNT